MLEAAGPGATFLLNSPYGPDEVWDHLPAHGAAADHRQEAEVLRDRRLQGRQEDRHGRAHQHHHADLLLRHLRRPAARGGHRRHQARHQEDLRQARRGGRAEELRRRGRRPGPPARGEGARHGDQHVRPAAGGVRRRRPEFVQKSLAHDHRRRRRQRCRSAPSRSTAPSRPPPRSGRSATSPWRSRSGIRTSASSAASASLVCPHAAIRAKVYDPALAGKGARRPSSRPRPAGRSSRSRSTRCRSRPRTAPAARCASRSARPRTRHEAEAARPSTWRRSRPSARPERANWDFFLTLPEMRPAQR